jgi:hypothetical protein
VVVLQGRRVAGACARARKSGVKLGDAVDRVRTLCPEAALAQLEPSALSAAWDAALELMYRVTPWIESVRPGMAYLAGLNALDAEALASELGLRIGVSSARGSALLAALAARGQGTRVVKDEAEFLSSVPVYLLRGAGIPAEVVERLTLFGLRTLGDVLMRVTQGQLERQFGKDAAPLWSLVTGGDARPVRLFNPASNLQASWVFEPPALEPHDWQAILEHLVDTLIEHLEKLLVGTLTLTLITALGEASARQILKCYSRERKTLIQAAQRLLLEAHSGIEFERLTLVFSDLLRPTPYQEGLFGALERPNVREAIKLVHQHYPDRLGKLEIVRPNAPLRQQRFKFTPLDGEQPRVKRKSLESSLPKPKRSRKK